MRLVRTLPVAGFAAITLVQAAVASPVNLVCTQIGGSRATTFALDPQTLHAAQAEGSRHWTYENGADRVQRSLFAGANLCSRTRQFVTVTPAAYSIALASRTVVGRPGSCEDTEVTYDRWIWSVDRQTGILRRRAYVEAYPLRSSGALAGLDRAYLRPSGGGLSEIRLVREAFRCRPAAPATGHPAGNGQVLRNSAAPTIGRQRL